MGTAIAAVIIRREKDLVVHFQQQGVLSPATAQTLSAMHVDEGLILRRLRSRAVIREAGSGLFYLDEPSWVAIARMRRRLVLVLLIVAVAGCGMLAVAMVSRVAVR